MNDKYKDVISFKDFLNNIPLHTYDIENIKDSNTCIECISGIIAKELKDCNVNERPLHCIMDKDENTETLMKNKEWIKEHVKEYDYNTPMLDENVLGYVIKVDKEIQNMDIDEEFKTNIKRIMKRIITKPDYITPFIISNADFVGGFK